MIVRKELCKRSSSGVKPMVNLALKNFEHQAPGGAFLCSRAIKPALKKHGATESQIEAARAKIHELNRNAGLYE